MIAARGFDLRMKDHPIPALRQGLGMRWNDRRARLLVQPRMRRGHVRFQAETIDRHGWDLRMQRQIDQQRGPSFSAQYFIKTNDPALSRDQLVTRLFAQSLENRIEQ